MDWSEGSYERFAIELEPASVAAVSELRPAPGERIVDLACGNGNAAITLARMGARVTGVDPARRLLGLAEKRFKEESLAAQWIEASAEQLPFPDDEFDGLVSVFGVIFAEDRAATAAEMRRVVKPGGAIVITAWRAEGGIAEAVKALRAAAAEHAPPPENGLEPMDWSSAEALESLFETRVAVSDRVLSFRAESAKAWVDNHREHDPAWLAVRKEMAAARFDELQDEIVGILDRHDVGSDGWEVRSPYVLVRLET